MVVTLQIQAVGTKPSVVAILAEGKKKKRKERDGKHQTPLVQPQSYRIGFVRHAGLSRTPKGAEYGTHFRCFAGLNVKEVAETGIRQDGKLPTFVTSNGVFWYGDLSFIAPIPLANHMRELHGAYKMHFNTFVSTDRTR